MHSAVDTLGVERSFALLPRFRRLSRDFERMPEVLAGLQFVAFAMRLKKHDFENAAWR